jgi:hypothetical protein
MDQTFSTDRSFMLQSNYTATSSPPAASLNNNTNYIHNMHQQVTTHPVSIPQKPAHANTFVHKLYK